MPLQLTWFATICLSLLTACGGGGGGSEATHDPASGVLSGTATKGPIANATVTAYGVSGGHMSDQIGTATTDSSGNFTLSVGHYSGAVMLRVGGGSYTDEATGVFMAMAPGDVMTAVMPTIAAGATTSAVQVTPITAMAQALADHMTGGMSDANIKTANAAIGAYFAISDIVHTHPMNPLMAGAAGRADLDARNYGMTLAAMSQYAKSLSMTSSSAMVTAMMDDASDGIMDGKAGDAQVSMRMGGMMGNHKMASAAGSSDLSAAMAAFMNSAANVSGMAAADLAALIQKLAVSSGRIEPPHGP